MDKLAKKILTALREKPYQTTDEIAHALSVTRSSVRKILNNQLNDKVTQNRLYQWSLFDGDSTTAKPVTHPNIKFANTDLAQLCKYYLACIGYDDPEISTPSKPNESGLDYFESSIIPETPEDFLDDEGFQQLLTRKRSEIGRSRLFFGYPVKITHCPRKNSKSKIFKLEPLILLPIERDTETRLHHVDINFPIINQTAVKNCANLEEDDITSEIADLERDLGLTEQDRFFRLDEIAIRLQRIRRDWKWIENIDPDNLKPSDIPLSELRRQGIYNRAVVMMVGKSNITLGLEQDLQSLAKLPENQYQDSVLGKLLQGKISSDKTDFSGKPLIEVLPMNLEQRQAVEAGLTRTLTVVTGPPGTGKSQVATNLIVNAALRGKRVLFASKNHQAVNVLEHRVNELSSRPFLLRLGYNYERRLGECLLEMLNAMATDDDRDNFDVVQKQHENLLQHFDKLEDQAQQLIKARNRVDELEKKAELARNELGDLLFKEATTVDKKRVSDLVTRLREINMKADINNASFLERLFWNFVKSNRFKVLSEAVSISKVLFEIMHAEFPNVTETQESVENLYASCLSIDDKLKTISQLVVPYQNALSELLKLRSLEEITVDQIEVLREIARNSGELWRLWVLLRPSDLSAKDKQSLSSYKSLLDEVSQGGQGDPFSYEIRKRFEEMLTKILYLLPCWAVTSLSVGRRIPLTPKIFDLVVIDEASQCDIASALPLLFRAKSAVIIGDSMQLTHIAKIPRNTNRNLWNRFGIAKDSVDNFLIWSYSSQSLFDLCTIQVSADKTISLRDHHRSHADIINFSNEQFYSNKLRVATNYALLQSPDPTTRGVRWYDVEGDVERPANGGARNLKEARSVVNVLRKLLEKFSGSVGVVTPFRAQADLIWKEIYKDEDLFVQLDNRDFLANTVHKFQGDERDVILFSPVVSRNFPKKSLGFLKNKNLFNVAITRARAKLLVVGDRKACEGSSLDLLSSFAKYVGNLSDQAEEIPKSKRVSHSKKYPSVANPERVSSWEHNFYEAAFEEGIRLIPQYAIEKYVVDFLMIDGKRKLVIEIDGETYHKNYTGDLCRKDQLRNIRLYELGYDVFRFWVYEVRDNLDSCLEKLKQWKSQH